MPVTPAAKPTATDLAAEWEDDGGDVEMKEVLCYFLFGGVILYLRFFREGGGYLLEFT